MNATQRMPRPAVDWFRLGQRLLAQGRLRWARRAWQRYAELAPQDPGGHGNLGVVLQRLGRLHDAAACYRRALVLDPASAPLQSNLASALKDLGCMDQAERLYHQALQNMPGHHRLRSNWLFSSCHLPGLSAAELYQRHRSFGLALAGVQPLPALPSPGLAQAGRRLRLGLVSGDLFSHSVAHFLQPVLAALDRQAFEVCAYATAGPSDATTRALSALCSRWRRVDGLDDAALAACIRADGIDILIDLSGHTAGNRLPMFALRPAPLQLTWIGYPCTTGLPAIDYLITDEHLAPPGGDCEAFVEALIRLPAAVAFAPPAQAPAPGPTPMLRRGHPMFGSFHRPAKLGDSSLQRWAAVLKAVPGARLLLGHCDDADTADRLAGRLARLGIPASALVFSPRLPMQAYLALHAEVDLLLDACDFSGGTTTALALWMGVPTLAVAGHSMPARQTAAVMQHAGLPGFITTAEDRLPALAAAWAAQPDRLNQVRAGLRQRLQALPLLREHQVTRAFEQAMRQIWQRWCAGLPPQALRVDVPQAAQAGVHADVKEGTQDGPPQVPRERAAPGAKVIQELSP